MARGLPTPAFDSQPDMYPDLADVWRCFWLLNLGRGFGANGVPAPISSSDIAATLEIEDVEPRERPTWLRLLRAMDVTWLGATLDEWKKKAPKAPKLPGRKRNSGNTTRGNRR